MCHIIGKTFDCIGIVRHRLTTDGNGVTTLVGGAGCPLDCKYCLNPQCHNQQHIVKFTIDELYERVKIDSLYFEATGGGVTFGGGEPLLQADFVLAFIKKIQLLGHSWRFCVETSLAVPLDSDAIGELARLIDCFIVDVKDMNPDIYRAYTGCNNSLMCENLYRLARSVPDKLHIRLPLIPSFNTEDDVERSAVLLADVGVTDVERFVYRTNIRK